MSQPGAVEPSEARLPPVTALGLGAMGLVVAGGIYVLAYLPGPAPLALPFALLGAAAALLTSCGVWLSRVPAFAWDRFFQVAGWALAAYLVIAALLEFVFISDGARGGELLLITLTVLLFALDVPLLLGFGVARYQEVGPPA
ncbi:MAG: hypothetical protein ACREOD_07535 [Candidatus Dormibacteria bacterium]